LSGIPTQFSIICRNCWYRWGLAVGQIGTAGSASGAQSGAAGRQPGCWLFHLSPHFHSVSLKL